jgi:hypothetical protein
VIVTEVVPLHEVPTHMYTTSTLSVGATIGAPQEQLPEIVGVVLEAPAKVATTSLPVVLLLIVATQFVLLDVQV